MARPASLAVITLAAAALAGCGSSSEYAGLSRDGASWGAEHAFSRERVSAAGSRFELTKSRNPSGARAWLAVARRHGRSTCVWLWAENETTVWYALERCSA